MNVTQQQLLELQQQGYETTWIHVEDSDSYETGVINISETLALFGTDDNLQVKDMHNTWLFAHGDELFANSAMLSVFLQEQDALDFCVEYIMDDEECELTREQAVQEVLTLSGKA